jgi:hypothetical protein
MDPTRHTEQTPSARPTPRPDQTGDESKQADPQQAAAPSEESGNGQRASGEAPDDISHMTRDELYDRARELGIPGRSMMTKVQLLQAVRMAMASPASRPH